MKVLEGKVWINGTDIWKEYGVFLVEKKRGGRENLSAIMAASKVKKHTPVDIREQPGEKYARKLLVVNEARDVTLRFALLAEDRAAWLERYASFIGFLKQGKDGWLDMEFPDLGKTLHVFYQDSDDYEPLTTLWQDSGRQISRFTVKFREPQPTI